MAKRIVVNLWREVLIAFDGDRTIFTFDCVSGDREHPTEDVEVNVPGHGIMHVIDGNVVRHQVLRKVRNAVSRTYNNTPMPYALFFTHDGKAIHQGYVVGFSSFLQWADIGNFGSHGCVRLSDDHAAQLYTWTPIGTEVIIVGHACNHSPISTDVERARAEAGVPNL
jgi:hypothetical protein